jgi:hypothetical protein
MQKIDKIGGPIIAVFLVAGIVYAFYKSDQLHQHYAFTGGTVTAITPPGYRGYGDYSVLYTYVVNGRTYHDSKNYKSCSGQTRGQIKALLIGKHFPVVYDTIDAATGILLLIQDDADKFRYTLPDSVQFYDSVLTCK